MKLSCELTVLLLLNLNTFAEGRASRTNTASENHVRSLELSTYVCPSVGRSTSVPSGSKIRIEIANEGELCTLTKQTKSSTHVPVGRSYDGHAWERVAGGYSSHVIFNCQGSYCEVTIPEDALEPNQLFQLNNLSSQLTKRDEAARFLEQTTFGTTRGDLNKMTQGIDDNTNLIPKFKAWIENQINEASASSHRAFYRRYATSRFVHPTREGKQSRPCEVGARFRWYAFSFSDRFERVKIEKMDGRYALSINGEIRTMVGNLNFESGKDFKYDKEEDYVICWLQEKVYGAFSIKYDGECERFQVGNPAIRLPGMEPQPHHILNIDISNRDNYVIDVHEKGDNIETMLLKNNINDDSCDSIPYPIDKAVYARLSNGQYMILEPGIKLVGNKTSKPLRDGGGKNVIDTNGVTQCANVERTFLNEQSCKLSDQLTACAPYGIVEGAVTLSPDVLRKVYELKRLPVYAIVDLRLEDDDTVASPCTPGERSRWIKIDSCTENVNAGTVTLLSTLLRHGRKENPNVKDIYLQDSGNCHWQDREKRQLFIKVDGQCYKNVHPDTYNVYDFTAWVALHPGGPNPITQPGDEEKHMMQFPRDHLMTRWRGGRDKLQYIGRLGDELEFADIPIGGLQDHKVAEAFGMYMPKPEGENIVICGSPNEVANHELSVPRFFVNQGGVNGVLRNDEHEQQRKTVWLMIALHGSDQLRQRMAWALSQLLVISPSAVYPSHTESFLAYYDIFVRNAFGSYRDILREVSYSPMMSDMLTYYASKSSEYMWKTEGTLQYADENYAREIMQLFSVGLVKLNLDGTPMLDSEGKTIQTYSNEDITEYARVWTGFGRQGPRGNVEDRRGNSIDPMKIRVDWRDHFPKLGLDGKYIGDLYPLCEHFPSDSFLRKGAKWKLLGKTKLPKDQDLLLWDKTTADDPDSSVHVITLNRSSVLGNKLCKASEGKCTFPSIVEINYHLPCTGVECNLSGIRVVEVREGIYYEFIRPPCVSFPFFESGKRVSKSRSNLNEDSTCVSKHSAVAAPACCDNSSKATYGTCAFTGERVAYEEAKLRCLQHGKEICEYSSVLWSNCDLCCNYAGYFWLPLDCSVYAIIDDQGKVAIERQEGDTELDYLSLTFFRVHWDNDKDYPKPGNFCDTGSCEPVGPYCRCEVGVSDVRVFQSMPSRSEILSNLKIGGVNPLMKDYDSSEAVDDFILHIADSGNPFGKETMFEVTDEFGRKMYLMNTKSIVNVGGDFQFRNTPSFYNANPEVIDAQYETEAALDHYFYHSNTAPFLAFRFIQRFGISNPSPGFVERVANAFKNGSVNVMPSIGTGEYGDLGATITAIILDKETRSVILDADPSHGSIREPLIKVIALMRNLNYQQTNGQFTSLYGLQTMIGEGMHDMPSVFSFFLPEYSPPGELSASSLVSPEAMLLPYSIGTINGMISLIKFGVSSCYGGFGNNCKRSKEGRLMSTTNKNADIIDDLATMLTSGRMCNVNRQAIRNLYTKVSSENALSSAQQLVITSPEFHTTSVSRNVGSPRPKAAERRKTCKRHKSVVHILLKGGCDSFNLLVPHSQCNGNNLYKQYKKERGPVAIAKRDLLEIDASSSLQQCRRFGLHPKLSTLQSLYNGGDALFFAGIGIMTNYVSKANYLTNTETQLFAHNTLQAEIGRLDPYKKYPGTGILGRLLDALHLNNYNVNAFAVDTSLIALEGERQNAKKVAVRSSIGFQMLNPSAPKSSVSALVPDLNGNVENYSGMYSNKWSSSLLEGIHSNNELYWADKSHSLANRWDSFPDTDLGKQLRRVAKMVGSNECRGADRDIYYIETGRYDHHANVLKALDREFTELDHALSAFVAEMKAEEKWDDITVVVSSDFGRTLSPNSGKGTDHGWSGSSFILGGQVKGGRILGEYPIDLSSSSPLNIGRGRFIPTTPFEAVWHGVIKWLGVDTDEGLDKVLPNKNSFLGKLFDESDLYGEISEIEKDCEGEGSIVTCVPDDYEFDDDIFDDDIFDNDVFDDKEDGIHISKGGIGAAITASFISVLCILAGVAFVYNKRTRRLSLLFIQIYGYLHKNKRGEEQDKFIYVDREESNSDDETAANLSLEVDINTLKLLHLRNQDGIEMESKSI